MFVIVFGVSGVGKTTIGHLLAEQLGWSFYDADDFHPASNVEKMRQGIPLTDEDRKPWLDSLRNRITQSLQTGENAVLACSALKESYRQYLKVNEQVRLFYLKGSFELIQARMNARRGHFMNPALLQSQFKTLEIPKAGITEVDVTPEPAQIVQTIRKTLGV